MILGRTDAELAEWHRWFAWYPVPLKDGRQAWLRWLERRVTHPFPDPGREREYRLPRRGLGHSADDIGGET